MSRSKELQARIVFYGTNAPIRIVSGEGEQGSITNYNGKHSGLALLRKLNAENCHGDRWSRAEICVPENVITGENPEYWQVI